MVRGKAIPKEVVQSVFRMLETDSAVKVAAAFGHTRRWITYIRNNFNPESGAPFVVRKRGAGRATDLADDAAIKGITSSMRTTTLPGIYRQLHDLEIQASNSTILRRIHEWGGKQKASVKDGITEVQKERRYHYANLLKQQLTENPNRVYKVLFSDEIKMDFSETAVSKVRMIS